MKWNLAKISRIAGSLNAIDWGGVFAAMKQKLKRGSDRVRSRKHTSLKKQQEKNKGKDFDGPNALDFERLG
jgi:hypothetical protein